MSASRCMGTLEPWASSTRRMIWARAVSSPTAVTWICTDPVVFMVAPMTGSPAALSTGRLSPVSMRLVHRGRAGDDDAVDGDLLAGADADDVADDDVLDGNVDLGAVADDAGGLRCQPDQGGDGGGGALLRPGLHPLPGQDQRDDDERGLVVDVQRQPPPFGERRATG